ncbi:MAG: FAD-dependent oxidoreductase [Myxococcales bacterium]|nr:FAD-dependent oxidoreductase [Myxococcales bacterium]
MARSVAVVGSGPSGFYAAAAVLKQEPDARVDVLDRLPTPYGLVRGGVAPDHQKVKTVVRAFGCTAALPGFRFLGNVELGRHVTLEELQGLYDQVILAVGAPRGRTLGVPGEDLPGVHTATDFVGWYNGHPDHQDLRFDLDAHDVVVVGMGNVAMDVTRILASAPGRLDTTDITDRALQRLRHGTRRRIHVLGRRGPVQAAFTPKEAQEIAALDGVQVCARAVEAAVDPVSAAWLAEHGGRSEQANVDMVAGAVHGEHGRRRMEVWLRFLVSPVAFLGEGRLEAVRVERNTLVDRGDRIACRPTGVFEEIPCQAAFLAVGYRSVPIPGVPFDADAGIVPNDGGAVLDGSAGVPDLFVVGWAKRGPSGLIGHNRADSVAVVERMLATPVVRASSGVDPLDVLGGRTRVVTWADWERLDAHEVAAGEARGRPRVKLTDVDAMLGLLEK